MYPSVKQVNAATHLQLCSWYRFLPSPGSRAIGTAHFADVLAAEKTVMDRIVERVKELGGFTPEISKQLGW